MPNIESIKSHKILNSRGKWTIVTSVRLDDGSVGVQSVPNGASTGEFEAVCLPAEKAASVVNYNISGLLLGQDAYNQGMIDQIMLEEDGTKNKQNLGGNSILSVSLAVAKAAANSKGLELYAYLRELYSGEQVAKEDLQYPTPVFNILNGGKHAHNGLSFQEFMVIPTQGMKYPDTLELGIKVYWRLKKMLEDEGFSTGIGDEGGFAPTGFTTKKALEYIKAAVNEEYEIGKDAFLGMDVAAGSFYEDEKYTIPEEEKILFSSDMVLYYGDLLKDFEIIYLEDGLYEQDYFGWKNLMENYYNKLMVVADDLVVTNTNYLEKAVDEKLANAVIVKPNQVGSLSETFDFVRMAQKNEMSIVVSHRSGETAEDTFIADLALAVGADFLKSGAPVRGERVVKYNRLLNILAG